MINQGTQHICLSNVVLENILKLLENILKRVFGFKGPIALETQTQPTIKIRKKIKRERESNGCGWQGPDTIEHC